MELHQLRYFVATAETSSVSRAAERCHVAQPSLSQQLKKLEDELGVKLFDRLGRGMVLTDAGNALLPRARRILAEVAEVESRLADEAHDGASSSLSVAAIPTIAPYVLPPALKRLRDAYPDCRVSVREDLTENLLEAIAANEVDVAVMSSHPHHDLVESEVIGEEELLVVVPKGQPPENAVTIALADLRGRPTVSLQDIHCLGQQIDAFCSTKKISPDVVCRTTQLQTVFELVALGVGISLVPEMAAARDLGGRCRYMRLKTSPPKRDLVVVYRKGRTRPAAAERFIEFVRLAVKNGVHKLK